MIDTAFKTHKETPFGWVLVILWFVDALKARDVTHHSHLLAPR